MPEATPPSVAGTLIQGLLAVTREVVGADAVARGLATIAPSSRFALEHAMPGGWVPISAVEEGFEAIARVTGKNVAALHGQIARISVERALKTVWRMLLRLTTDNALVSRAPVLFSKSYNRGRIVSSIVEPGVGHVELLDWPNAPEWPIRGLGFGIETVLRVAGREDVHVEGKRTATGAAYSATWRRTR
jgi:hypothetical protein